MGRLRTGLSTILVASCVTSAAFAQPQPAPAPVSPPAPVPADGAPQDPVMAEQIAEELVNRAQELLDAKVYQDAKQLAVEALVKSPNGIAAERAKYIIKVVNGTLHIVDDPAPTPPSTQPVQPDASAVDLTPIGDPTQFDPSKNPPPVQAGPADTTGGSAATAATVHGIMYGGVIGASIGAIISSDTPAAGAVPGGIVVGLGAGLLARKLAGRKHWDEAMVRTTGSLNLWGGVIGGLFAEAVTGAGANSSPSAKGVLVGAGIGSTLGLLTGGVLAKNHKLTRGDVALVDTLAGIGAIGGLTMGMVMQPAQNEAYAVNSLLGAAAGVAIGVIAGPQTNTTPRRMIRVAAMAAAGGALPFLLYAGIHDSSTDSDERLVGFLSTAGLIAGAYLGFRLTRGMDAGLDVNPYARPHDDDAPEALLRRNSDGSWAAGTIAISPLDKKLASGPGQSGLGLTLVSGSF